MHARAICSDQCLRRDAARMQSQETTAVTSRDCDGGAQYILSARVVQTKGITPSPLRKYILDLPGIFDHRIERIPIE